MRITEGKENVKDKNYRKTKINGNNRGSTGADPWIKEGSFRKSKDALCIDPKNEWTGYKSQYRWAQAVWNKKKTVCTRRADQGRWSV